MRDQPTKPPMTPTKAAAFLEDILKWRLEIVPPQPGIRSTPTDTDGIRSSRSERLDFGLDQVIDTTASDGPRGCTSYEGVDKWLRFWVPWMSYWTGERAVFRREPGAWFLHQLQGSEALAAVAEWDEADQAAWVEFTSELTTMWWQVAHLTGHAPKDRGTCPRCHTGTLRSEPGRDGFSDEAVCSNPDCGASISANDIPTEQAAAIRGITTTDENQRIWIYGKQAIDLYNGALTWAMLRDWHTAGKLDRKGNRRAYAYPLATLNKLLQSQ